MPIIGRFWARIHGWLDAQVETVPEAIELCEFDCARAHCSEDQIARCERRLNFLARCARDAECRHPTRDPGGDQPSLH